MHRHFTTEQAAEALRKTTEKFAVLLKNGSMSVEYYTPHQADHQTPHRQDEIYVIASGQGNFWCAGEKTSFRRGDLLFVPAGMEHRFEEFTEDFATWVIFYGPEGGETGEV